MTLGMRIYQTHCHSCHGDVNLPGSIPLAFHFPKGQFQNAPDPYTMYQTITRGWRLMAPQVQLLPREKYAVIHYIRDAFLRRHNPTQLFPITPDYLLTLPAGDELGPTPKLEDPWREMNYGSFLSASLEMVSSHNTSHSQPWKGMELAKDAPRGNIAYKAIAQRLRPGPGGVAAGTQWTAFELDTLRIAGAWTGQGFLDWRGIQFDGRHQAFPKTTGKMLFETMDGPGWANPATGSFEDLRAAGKDGRRFGPLPSSWARYLGLHLYGERIVFHYRVGQTEILEAHEPGPVRSICRVLNVAATTTPLKLRLCNAHTPAALMGDPAATQTEEDGYRVLNLSASNQARQIAILVGVAEWPTTSDFKPSLDLAAMTHGGPRRWAESFTVPVIRGEQEGPFQWDSLSLPVNNPWKTRLRLTGVDFTQDGSTAFVCTWDGDVWRVEDAGNEKSSTVTWTRVASGLFQPLGICARQGEIFVSCRDQIVRLVDQNGDGEADFYQCVNHDHQVTEHFHEFAMGLQMDDDGNFYYAKSARHAKPPLVPQHGTLLQVAADGSSTTILAHGFRAANGVCRNPDGTFFVTDQEGHWNPMNRINHVLPGNRFYGNMWGYGAPGSEADSDMEQPLCWVEKSFDRSPSELLWIQSPSWGPLNGKLLNLSYGHGRLEIVPFERMGEQLQGGVSPLPIPDLPTGIMRGRFSPADGHLYVCGLSAWGTEQMHLPGGFYRIRATGRPIHVPVGLEAKKQGVVLTFSEPVRFPIERSLTEAFEVRSWSLKRSMNYGSKHYNEMVHFVEAVEQSKDGRSILIRFQYTPPVWQLAIRYHLLTSEGLPLENEVQSTIHRVTD